MKKFRKTLLTATAVLLILSMTACGDDNKNVVTTPADGNTTTASGNDQTAADTSDGTDSGDYDDSMTLTWMSHYDINPADGDERSVELALFEDTYGGKIEYKATSWEARFDDLAKMIAADKSPDIFPYEWIAFPNGVMKNQYKPIDELVDWTSDLWKDTLDDADGFVYNGKHYVAPFFIQESLLLIYDKTLVDEEGYDDPYDLYQEGKWDWNAFKKIMQDFCDNGENRLGITGAFGRSLVQSTGETFVTYDGTTFKNNINSPAISRVQEFLCELAKQGITGDGTYYTAADTFKSGNILFYGSGRWDIKRAARATDHELFVVPMPKDPESDQLYVAENLQSHMWVAGSKKAKAVKTWFECNRIVQTDPEYQEQYKQTTMASNKWSEEIYDAVMDLCGDKFKKVFDYGYGINADMEDTIEKLYNICCYDNDENTGWANIRDSYYNLTDSDVNEING